MPADRPTGRTVTLPLVWQGDYLTLGGADTVKLGRVGPTFSGEWVAASPTINLRFPTRSAAERAVEDAVVKALGADG